jgi:Protein of unknown function (DUF4239)
MSTFLIVMAIAAGSTVITVGIIALVRWLVPFEFRGHEERRGWVFAFCGVLCALVIGFVLAYSLSGYNSASRYASDEADSVSALSRTATLLPAEDRDIVGHRLICYARAVIYDEWPLMAEGRRSVLATAATDRLFQSLGQMVRDKTTPEVLDKALDGVRGIGQARASRLLQSRQSLPAIFWAFLIGGGLVLTLYASVLAGQERRVAQFLFIAPVTVLLVSSIYLVFVFERPFDDPSALKPQAMHAALDSVREFIPDPRAGRPCP